MFDPSLKYRTIDTEHFSIHYPERLEDIAQKTAVVSEEVFNRLSPKYDWVPWGRTQVLLEDFTDDANGAASVLPYNWLYIRIAAPESNSSLNNFDDWLRLLITHEYVHILHLDKVGGIWKGLKYIIGKTSSPNGVVPGWFKEGISTYEETRETEGGRGRSSFAEMILRTAVLNDKFLPIDLADGDQWKWPGNTARYIYGVKFIEYLASAHGEDKLYEFIDRVSRSPLLFEMNRQARIAFSKMEFETIKVHNRYVKQKKPGAPISKTFYALWKDWHEELKKKYKIEEEKIKGEGVTPLETVVASKNTLSTPAISPDGKKIVYVESSVFGPPMLKIADIDGKNSKRLLKDVYATNISYSPDGTFIIYSKAGKYKKYQFVHDIYRYDLGTKKVEQLTKGKRAGAPSISPDGKEIVVVTQNGGTARLELYNFETKEMIPIPIDVPRYTQFSSPKFSPDGKKIAVAMAEPGFIWDLAVFDRGGKQLARMTEDNEVDNNPIWDLDGKHIYFISDRSGVSNIYRYNLKSRKTEKVTNVLTGIFQPVMTTDGREIIVQYYNGDGYDIRKLDITAPLSLRAIAKQSSAHPVANAEDKPLRSVFENESQPYELPYADTPAAMDLRYESKKYRPLGRALLLPRFVLPGFAVLDDAIMFSILTGGMDPLRWHNWTGGGTYRTDAKFFGYYWDYWYGRFKPLFNMGVMNYAVNFGNVTFTSATSQNTVHLFEKRLLGYAGMLYPIGKHAMGLRYFYEDHNTVNNLTAAEKGALNLGVFAGFIASYAYNDSKQYQASISREGGRLIKLSCITTNSIFGSGERNEQEVFSGEWREYIRLFERNVLVLRAAGGMVWGDQLVQGTFALGGSVGEGTLAGPASLFYFALRGLPASAFVRTRVMLLSSEYRFPLISVQRGLGTMPIFVKDLHVAAFADYGNAWNANQSPGKYFFGNFMLGTGLELRGDFVLGYGLPVTGRLGYGIIVVNRDRVAGYQDPMLKHPAKEGVLVLQLGTSY